MTKVKEFRKYHRKSQKKTKVLYLKQTKIPFFKNGQQEGKTGPTWRRRPYLQWEGGGYQERV
jgi:hypothetical protein